MQKTVLNLERVFTGYLGCHCVPPHYRSPIAIHKENLYGSLVCDFMVHM